MSEYIKRDTVVGLLDNLIERNNNMAQIELMVAKVNVNAIPAADVEPVVQGEWIDDEDYPESGLKVCSICGHDPLLNGHEERVLSKRCPNCGAHMERSGDA